MHKKLIFLSLIFIVVINACSQEMVQENPPQYTYLALGNSYTIGESVFENERFPVQLTDSLRIVCGIEAEETIVAKTGWTT